MFHVNLGVNVGKDFGCGQLVHLPGERAARFFRRHICAWGVGLDVRARKGGDIFARIVLGILGSGTGENDFLLEFEVLFGPPFLVEGPDALGVYNTHHALCRRG